MLISVTVTKVGLHVQLYMSKSTIMIGLWPIFSLHDIAMPKGLYFIAVGFLSFFFFFDA